ncbi:lipid A-modifier LpxR family protein [uncultured Algibacter sp.]|uniref:lipid A-modifier LpxR family protein n=1 Tax=uncultured Algibacter sp. TaxID=298659 RepID=UPI0032164328
MPLKKYIILFLYLLNALCLFSQENRQQLEFKVENDKLVMLDKYYTSGFFLTYRRKLQNDFVFKKTAENALQLNIVLGNETYTPTNLSSTNTADFDRPYAGWFYLKSELVKANKNSVLSLGVETGITGKEALSGEIQVRTHKFLGVGDNPTWEQEIPFKFLINLKGKYIYSKQLGKLHAFQYELQPTLGTKDIFVKNEIGYYFGRFNDLRTSTRVSSVDTALVNEFFAFISMGYKYVAHNTLIQGGLSYNETTFTTHREPNVLMFKIGGVLKIKRNTIKFIYNHNTRETPTSKNHAYGSLAFGRNF